MIGDVCASTSHNDVAALADPVNMEGQTGCVLLQSGKEQSIILESIHNIDMHGLISFKICISTTPNDLHTRMFTPPNVVLIAADNFFWYDDYVCILLDYYMDTTFFLCILFEIADL